MPCVFCGETNRKMSNEHVWPEWVRNLLPPKVLDDKYTYRFETDEGIVREVSFPLFELTVKDVCEDCNTGWMHRLEDAVKMILPGMLQGRGRVLHEGEQTKIAAWGIMKSLVTHRCFPQRQTAPQDHYRQVYELGDEQRPPDSPRIYTARAGWSDGKAPPGFYRLNGIVRTPPGETPDWDKRDGYMATFSVLNLVLQVFWAFDEDADFIFPSDVAPAIGQLWPSPKPFTWPPGPALTWRGIARAAGPETPKP